MICFLYLWFLNIDFWLATFDHWFWILNFSFWFSIMNFGGDLLSLQTTTSILVDGLTFCKLLWFFSWFSARIVVFPCDYLISYLDASNIVLDVQQGPNLVMFAHRITMLCGTEMLRHPLYMRCHNYLCPWIPSAHQTPLLDADNDDDNNGHEAQPGSNKNDGEFVEALDQLGTLHTMTQSVEENMQHAEPAKRNKWTRVQPPDTLSFLPPIQFQGPVTRALATPLPENPHIK